MEMNTTQRLLDYFACEIRAQIIYEQLARARMDLFATL